MRTIGMDIHRVSAEAVAPLHGKAARPGRVDMRRDRLAAFARSTLTHDDHVAVGATGNAAAVTEVLAPHVGRVVIANPKRVRLIAHAKIKTDAIGAAVPDGRTRALRRQVGRRERLVRQRTRLKDIVQSIPHADLVPPCPHADPFGAGGRAWLAAQALPEGERLAVERHVRTLDGLLADLRPVERDVARHVPDDGGVRRLMTVPGIDMVVAVGLAAAIGDVARFASAEKPVAYLGLNPSVRQSGDRNVYGWFERDGRGVYRLAPAGAAALLRWTALGDASVVDDAATTSGADALALAPSAGARGPAA